MVDLKHEIVKWSQNILLIGIDLKYMHSQIEKENLKEMHWFFLWFDFYRKHTLEMERLWYVYFKKSC